MQENHVLFYSWDFLSARSKLTPIGDGRFYEKENHTGSSNYSAVRRLKPGIILLQRSTEDTLNKKHFTSQD